MKINKSVTVFTSNQPRHLAIINALAKVFCNVNVIIETVTFCPGEVKDYYDKSPVMKEYFKNVRLVEKEIFGGISPLTGKNIKSLVIKYNDLNLLSEEDLHFIKESDTFIVFGSSFIKGWLVNFLVERKAINVHLGVSPYYRGSSCNFWSLYDKNFHLTGATIHLLTKGLDSGSIIFHALPTETTDAFKLGMLSVAAAIEGLIFHLEKDNLGKLIPVEQDKLEEVRYSRDADFTDLVAQDFLNNMPSPDEISQCIAKRANWKDFVNPFFGSKVSSFS
jgi:hypothetical protein